MLPKIEIVSISYIENLLESYDGAITMPLYFDTETQGLYGDIEVAQFYIPTLDPRIFLVKKPRPMSLVTLLSKFKHIVGHNLAYDLSNIEDKCGMFSEGIYHAANIFTLEFLKETKISDTFYASRLVYPREKEFSLKKIHQKVYNRDIYSLFDVDGKLAKKIKNWDLDNVNERNYCAIDVWILPDLYFAVRDIEDTKHEMNTQYNLDIKSMIIGICIQSNGYPVLKGKVMDKLCKLDTYIEKNKPSFNVNSFKQVREKLGVDEKTPTDKNHLSKMIAESFTKEQSDMARNILDIRSKLKDKSFLIKFYDNHRTDPSGQEIYYGHLSPGARSGRFTSTAENLQNIPRHFYDCFGTVNEDEVLITSDFSQLELRTFAAVVGDSKMAQAFIDNVDIHTLTTQQMFEKESPTSEERYIGKQCNFLLLYGGGPEILMISILKSGMDITFEQCEEFHNRFLNKAWTKIKEYKSKGFGDLRAGRVWKTILGRPYTGLVITDFLNIKIQGSGADIAKLALYLMFTHKDKEFYNRTGMKVRNFVHDSYVVTCNKDNYKEVAEFIADCMEKSWKICCSKGICTIRDIPMPIDVLVGKSVGGSEAGNIAKYNLKEGVGTWDTNQKNT